MFLSACCGSVAICVQRQLLHLAVLDRVAEVDHEANQHPDNHRCPCGKDRQLGHQVNRRDNAQDRHEGNQRRLEGPMQLGVTDAQNPDTGADDSEGQQSANVHQLRQPVDGQKGGHYGNYQADRNG